MAAAWWPVLSPRALERAQILEEHAFAAEADGRRGARRRPLVLEGRTLHHGNFMFSVSPWRGGASRLDDFEVLEWIGRFLARIHAVGAARPFHPRPALDLQLLANRATGCWRILIPLDVQSAWRRRLQTALDLIATWRSITAPEANST